MVTRCPDTMPPLLSLVSILKRNRIMPRILLLLFVLCVFTMAFVARFVFQFDAVITSSDLNLELLSGKCDELEKKYASKISDLERTVSMLEAQLRSARSLSQQLAEMNSNSTSTKYQQVALYLQNHFEQKFKEGEITHGISLNNEYELFPFCRFTLTRIYLVEPGLGKRVVEKPIGYKKKELMEVINYAVEKLNEKRTDMKTRLFSVDDFLEGVYRTEPMIGTHYELLYRDIQQQSTAQHYRRIIITRPYGPLYSLLNENISTSDKVIHVILPLKGRTDKFRSFMERYGKLCVRLDRRTTLTVVYIGEPGLDEVVEIIATTEKQYGGSKVTLIRLREDVFSRGAALQAGVEALNRTSENKLMFFCDVDVVFSTDFLERCRLHSQPGAKVYYPMVFSLYNPKVVYTLQDLPVPPDNDQLLIAKDAGFWRDFGYGMTCQYQNDFYSIGGFDSEITGWGLEDVYLYKKYVNSPYFVIRATDPGIFHLWHEKFCDPNLPGDQYKGCMRSKAFNEASHAQLGMLAFKNEIDVHKQLLKDKEDSLPKR